LFCKKNFDFLLIGDFNDDDKKTIY
jgi:hypothetical protein